MDNVSIIESIIQEHGTAYTLQVMLIALHRLAKREDSAYGGDAVQLEALVGAAFLRE